VPLFSRLALASVAALGLTGLYSGLANIASLEALVGTTYGITLVLKVGLFGVLFGLGALNLLAITPRLQERLAQTPPGGRNNPDGARWLALSVRTEMLVGLLLLAAVGVLAGSTPANDALRADQRVGYVGSYQQEGVRLEVWLAPARAGDNEVAIDVSDPRPQPAGQPAEVLVRFLNTQHNMGQTEVQAISKDGRRYTVRGSYLSMAGSWTVEVVLNVPDLNQISYAFPIEVADIPNE
jgi:copper transport protein